MLRGAEVNSLLSYNEEKRGGVRTGRKVTIAAEYPILTGAGLALAPLWNGRERGWAHQGKGSECW